jgi:putative oxidoreductase
LLLTAALIEVVAGGLMVVGLATRWAAFIGSGEVAVAYFMGHFPKSFWPGVSGGDLAIVFCFVFLYLVFVGPGPWSFDARLRRVPPGG